MDLELLNYVDGDLKWNSVKRGHRRMTRCPRKPRADVSELGNNRPNVTAFETNKIVDGSLKKRKLLQKSPLPPPQTLCLHGDRSLPAGPLTPSIYYEDPSKRCQSSSVSQSQKAKSKTRLRNKNISKLANKEDFSGIELLAAAACSILIDDTPNHVNEEHTAPGVNSCCNKETIISTESGSLIPDSQNLHDDGNQKVALAPCKESRLHWDLNTVMEEWEEPCDDLVVEHTECVSMNAAAVSAVPLIESCKIDDFLRKSCEPIVEDLGTKTLNSKTSDCESCVSKSDAVDSLIQGVKSEDVSTSTTTSVLQDETMVKCESMSNKSDDQQPVSELCKVSSEDPTPSDCCGSNVSDMDKVESGYDSPFEDGELREPTTGWEENNESSDNTCNKDFGTIENPSSEKVKSSRDHGQTMEDQSSLLVKDDIVQENTFDGQQRDIEESDCGSGKESSRRKNGHDESTSFAYAPHSRCRSIVRGYEHDRQKAINRNYAPHSGYQNRRPSSSERNNNGYGGDFHRSQPNRYRYQSQEYNHHDPKSSCYSERKVRCYSPKRRSRSRSRSGSPIAWHFQKRKSSNATPSLDDVSPERFPKSFDDRDDAQCRGSMIRRIGYPERSKSDDRFRFCQQSGRFSTHRYKDSGYTYSRK